MTNKTQQPPPALEAIISTFADMGIKVFEVPPAVFKK